VFRSFEVLHRWNRPPANVDRYEAVNQYTLAQILAVLGLALAYPLRRSQSACMGIIVHSAQSVVVVIIVVLTLVL
jgi:hypothetical protein